MWICLCLSVSVVTYILSDISCLLSLVCVSVCVSVCVCVYVCVTASFFNSFYHLSPKRTLNFICVTNDASVTPFFRPHES